MPDSTLFVLYTGNNGWILTHNSSGTAHGGCMPFLTPRSTRERSPVFLDHFVGSSKPSRVSSGPVVRCPAAAGRAAALVRRQPQRVEHQRQVAVPELLGTPVLTLSWIEASCSNSSATSAHRDVLPEHPGAGRLPVHLGRQVTGPPWRPVELLRRLERPGQRDRQGVGVGVDDLPHVEWRRRPRDRPGRPSPSPRRRCTTLSPSKQSFCNRASLLG